MKGAVIAISTATPSVALWLNQRIEASEACLDAGFAEAALALLYSGIDTLAFLDAPASSQDVTGHDFIVWCDQYIVPSLASASGLTGVDLYGARCGVLHVSSAASRLGREGKAREVWYQLKGGAAVNLMTNTPQPAVLLDIEALMSAFAKGSQIFVANVEADPARLVVVQGRVQQFFSWGVLLRPKGGPSRGS